MSDTKQAIDNIMNSINQVKLFGEDALLAYNTYKELKDTGSRLVNKYGKGVGQELVLITIITHYYFVN